jgi:hypothetical protein
LVHWLVCPHITLKTDYVAIPLRLGFGDPLASIDFSKKEVKEEIEKKVREKVEEEVSVKEKINKEVRSQVGTYFTGHV